MNMHRLAYLKAAATVTDVIEAITASQEWEENSQMLSAMDYMGAREIFRRFFDAYEGSDCEEWLGIMEWAVIEELRVPTPASIAKPAIIDAIVSRMEHHPNVSLDR